MVESPVRSRMCGFAVFVALLTIVAVGVAVYVLLNRLSDEVLTVIATVGCAGGISLPALVVALAVLLRSRDDATRRPQTMTIPPQIMVVPPMQLPQLQPPSRIEPGPQIESVSAPRHFVIVGEED